MIIFENEGILDVDMIKTFGISAKENDNPIGFFGTGLKYAIAIILREGGSVTIYSGKDKLEFSTLEKESRGKKFNFITMNGEQLSFTTELGKNWVKWQAFRELYSNAKDEGGSVLESEKLPEPSKNKTYVCVRGLDIEYKNRHNIFMDIDKDILCSDHHVEICKGSGSFFQKGVKVWNFEGAKTLFNYNDSLGLCDLTEDRQIKLTYQVSKCVSEAIALCRDVEILQKIITAPKTRFEGVVDFDYCYYSPSDEFLKTMKLNIKSCNNVHMINYYEKHKPKAEPILKELNQIDQNILNESIEFLKRNGYRVDDYSINVYEKLDNNAIGMAYNGEIYISYDAFTIGGETMVKATLFEEWVHLEYGYQDCCRDMQNYLFERVIHHLKGIDSLLSVKNNYAA